MAVPITFAAFTGWTDATDPNNIPAEVRIIAASDLMRYETFGTEAAEKINSIESTVEEHTTALEELSTAGGTQGTALTDLQTWKSTADTDITALKKKLLPVITKTANYTATAADDVIIGNGASLTITLPSAVAAGNGKVLRVKNKAATALTVASTAGTIDGAATKSVAQWGVLAVVSDGANWFVV